MKRAQAWLFMFVLWLLICGCSRKPDSETNPPGAAPVPEAKPEQSEIKEATPEDPGSIATTVVPLLVLKARAKPLPTKPEVDGTTEPLSVDHPVSVPEQKPRNFLHQMFSVNNYVQFAFLIPPHQWHPRLRGDFRSFTRRDHPDSTLDKPADVDLMLLTDQEFNEFRHSRMESATHELEPAHDQVVDWSVPPSYDQPQRYHLVFSNSRGVTGTTFVKADFTVSFE
jgi:hypothetical protein